MAPFGALSQAASLRYAISHIFLPPKLPQSDDYVAKLDEDLLDLAIKALSQSRSDFVSDDGKFIDRALDMLRNTRKMHVAGSVNESMLQGGLARLHKDCAPIPVHVRAQNAGVLISVTNDGVMFQTFELSPLNESVQACKGRLRRQFPATSIEMTNSVFQEGGLQKSVSCTLANLSSHKVAGMQPQVRKAGQSHDETRDTTHPAMITEVFHGFLMAVGEPAEAPSILKNTREEVLWCDTEQPWRRSSLWLLVRVSLQLYSVKTTGSDTAYKKAMVSIMKFVLRGAVNAKFESEILHCMIAKLARRIRKLDLHEDTKLFQSVQSEMLHAATKVATAWSKAQAEDTWDPQLARLAHLDFRKDSILQLGKLDNYIEAMKIRTPTTSASNIQLPKQPPKFPANELPGLSNTGGVKSSNFVLAVEEWVEHHLQNWIEDHTQDSRTCDRLSSLIESYHSLALLSYSENSVDLSVMVLTVAELWVACDKAALAAHSLLREYKPGVSIASFENLLLPFKDQMDRLHSVERYITHRHRSASFHCTLLFVEAKNPNCFPARYFDSSIELQGIHEDIVAQGRQGREQKLAELAELKRQHQRLTNQARNSEHDLTKVRVDSFNNFFEDRHLDRRCQKCRLERQAEGLEIGIHEWPLPNNETWAKTVVFELRPPPIFHAWRSSTIYLIRRVLRATYKSLIPAKSKGFYELERNPQLMSFATQCCGHGVSLASVVKPHTITHRKSKRASTASEDDVCLSNGLAYQYYDQERLLVSDFVYDDDLAHQLTFTMPEQSKVLQKFLFRPHRSPNGPDPNIAIADQGNAPQHMSIEEFRELAIIPLGHQVHWFNIAAQLEGPTIDFKKAETSIMVFQCIYQAGPPKHDFVGMRNSHAAVANDIYGNIILKALTTELRRIRKNWESAQALHTLSSIACRLLSLTSASHVVERCYEYLEDLSSVAYGWVQELREKIDEATSDEDRIKLNDKCVEIAFVCALSFDIDAEHLGVLLDREGIASRLFFCYVIIHEGRTSIVSQNSASVLMKSRFHRMSMRATELLKLHRSSLNDAIQEYWRAYQPGSEWKTVPDHENWLTSTNFQKAQLPVLHYNVLNGELLVNGLPLGRPPKQYEDNPMWSTFFGKSAVEVLQSSVPGMQFFAKRRFYGYDVEFGLDTGSNALRVRATKGNLTYESVPSCMLGPLPDFFVNGFVHWYNHSENTVEFRPKSKPWNESSDCIWRLVKQETGWQLARGDEVLVGLSTESADTIADILHPLAEARRIHIICQSSPADTILVELPAIDLGFFVNLQVGSLVSREYRGFAIAEDQSLGSFIGFRSKLVLKQSLGEESCVLLPEGPITYVRNAGHTKIQVNRNAIGKVHKIAVNRQLRRLEDNGSLQSKLYSAYVHALSSGCLPDPLIGYTGTEAALNILKSAAVRSFDHLGQTHLNMLLEIAKLSPTRSFYPESEQVMQTIDWNDNLSFLSQHDEFRVAAQSLLRQDEESVIFTPDSKALRRPKLENCPQILMDRANLRSSTFRLSGFGAEAHTSLYDDNYSGRDLNQVSQRCRNAYSISNMLYNLSTSRAWNDTVQLWERSAQKVESVQSANLAIDQSLFNDFSFAVNKGVSFAMWPALHKLLSKGPDRRPDRFALMTWLSALSANGKWSSNMETLQMLALFCTSSQFQNVAGPDAKSCKPSDGKTMTRATLARMVDKYHRSLEQSPERHLPKLDGELWPQFQSRRNQRYKRRSSLAINHIVGTFYDQWPREVPDLPRTTVEDINVSDYVDVSKAFAEIKGWFKTCYDNLVFAGYFQRLESVFQNLPFRQIEQPSQLASEIVASPRSPGYVPAYSLFAAPAPLVETGEAYRLNVSREDLLEPNSSVQELPRMEALIESLKASSTGSDFEREYVERLRQSLQSLQQQQSNKAKPSISQSVRSSIIEHAQETSQRVAQIYGDLVSATDPPQKFGNVPSYVDEEVLQWPRVCPTFFLRQLNSQLWSRLSESWQKAIVQYGLALVAERRASSLLDAVSASSINDLLKDIANKGHEAWDPFTHPQWLLLEVEAGITIRENQAQIASQMMNPHSNSNTVMQLNMGEGKSSVIAPMVAVDLADGSQLVRVVVAKPQSKQMSSMLIAKLGGLMDRRIRFMPFSRGIKLTASGAALIERMLLDCKTKGDVLLVQPEHVLSLKLMGLETYTSGIKEDIGKVLVQVQDFSKKEARTIVDESDENFSVKFEVVYTMGTQRPIEFSPGRWNYIQQVLSIVALEALEVKRLCPTSIELTHRHHGDFPRLRILKEDAEALLVGRVANNICELGGMDSFPIARQSPQLRAAVSNYIAYSDITAEQIKSVEHTGGFWTDSTKEILLLLRGLLAEGVLGFVLRQKRWRVNYGLASTRTPPTRLAVPYHAKDAPTPRSEFSHPEVVICLTSLSYYYGGLTDDEMFATLGHLVDQDDRDVEYANWVKRAPGTPSFFRTLEGINLQDTVRCTSELFPFLQYNKGVIDYYLSRLVFPKEIKEFPFKLSASGWDLGAKTGKLTTGFSGTTDSRVVLPLDIEHLDLPAQEHTNALVLEYLLGPENSIMMMAPQSSSSPDSDADQLLQAVINLPVPTEVILDVGAQILELDNLGVAKRWLQLDNTNTKRAVVFVDDKDELSVVDRKGRVEALQTSPYFSQLDSCFIFLDEAHTRGIDLRLPEHYRAAVTLGPNLTKDRLVQACMRMRKLGKGQSVTFCVNSEIQAKIKSFVHNGLEKSIDVADVICWSISETFKDMRKSMPLWAMQGGRFLRQEELWNQVDVYGKTSMTQAHAETFLEEEAISLEKRYRPLATRDTIMTQSPNTLNARMPDIRKRCAQFDHLDFHSSTLQEEQERELSPEVEQERQIQRPPSAKPLSNSIHPDVEALVEYGTIKAESKAYMHAFQCFGDTSIASLLVEQLIKPDNFLVTTDFAETIVGRGSKSFISDQFQRPVQWVLALHDQMIKKVTHLVIVSPFEAQALFNRVRASKRVTLRLYKPRCNASHPCSFDDLTFLSVPQLAKLPEMPPNLLILLHLFAGQLYFKSLTEYLETCKLLGLAVKAAEAGEEIDASGFILRHADGSTAKGTSPIKFLQVLMSKIRRCDQSISKTHVGGMLEGKILTRADVEGDDSSILRAGKEHRPFAA